LIYFDNQATTQLAPEVWEVMAPLYQAQFGNPSASDTRRGRAASKLVNISRIQLASAVGTEPRNLIFTSGATEANNLAIKGAMALQVKKNRPRVLTFSTEHKCVTASVQACEEFGAKAEILPVQRDGLINISELEKVMDHRVGMISAMAVHNEIGVIQNLSRIGEIAERNGALFHCDMAQALGKIPVNLESLPIALASFSAHKAYGPMGIGALYVRRRPKAHLQPLLHGGGQERGLRSGSLPLPLIAGFGKAAELAADYLEDDLTRIWKLRDRVLEVVSRLPSVHLNGHEEQRVPGNLNLRFEGMTQAQLRDGFRQFEFSRGSSCSAEDLEPSFVLSAMGLSHQQAASSIRLSIGRYTTELDVEMLCAAMENLCL